jgi:polysaccharide biosynthesis/export protein
MILQPAALGRNGPSARTSPLRTVQDPMSHSGSAAALITACLIAFAPPLPAQSANASTSLRPGDALQIEVWRQPEFSGRFEIAPDGTIAHPLYRNVQVVGAPMDEVERRIGRFISGFESNPDFVVSGIIRVPVGGEVMSPSVYEVPPGTSIAQAIGLAGGPRERGRLDRVVLRRDGSTQTVNLANPGAADAAPPLQSGDQVFVQRRREVLRDYVGPAASVLGLLVTVFRIVDR